MLGLVLTAGGARGAYQAGVLKRIGESPLWREKPCPFPIICGASAGAINGAALATGGAVFHEATSKLADLWASLRVEQVFRIDRLSMLKTAIHWARDLGLGGLVGASGVQALLDCSPLETLLRDNLDFSGIAEGIRSGRLYAVAVSATSYNSGRSFTFIQGKPGHPVWQKSRRVALSVELRPEHIHASAAIPVVFAPVRIRSEVGDAWFGDGGLRLVTPLSPAIRLGATRLFAIGIRCPGAADDLSKRELRAAESGGVANEDPPAPPLAQICGVFLNAIFLDHLDADLDHLKRLNEVVRSSGQDSLHTTAEPIRTIEALAIKPSADLAIIAQAFSHRMPRRVRYLMDGLGTPDAQSADLMSYLLFDGAYTRALIDVGYQDAGARLGEIEALIGG